MSNNKPNIYNNLFLPTESSGVWFWRGLMALQTCWSLGQNMSNINNSVLHSLSLDKNLYQQMNMVMVQRYVDERKTAIFNEAIVPMSEMFGFWKVYNIDDLTDCKYIPKYNKGRRAYLGKKTQDNLAKTMNNADFILTTTEYLMNAFHKSYNIPLENFICIPNLLPRWWIGSFFNPAKKVELFRKHKNKPRVGITSSLSHFNPDEIKQDKNGYAVYKDVDKDGKVVYHNEIGEVVDISTCENVKTDLDTILSTIIETIDEIQWVFFGYVPPELEQYAKNKQIEVHAPIPIINYPGKLDALNLNAIVSPLITDYEFNKCKTNIKWLESCATGIPLLAPDIVTYSPYMPERQIYKDSNDLLQKLLKLKKMSATVYEETIMKQWKFINSPFVEAGNNLKNWWLEDNIGLWLKLFRLPQKSRTVSMQRFKAVQDKKKQEEQKNIQHIDENSEIIFKNEDVEVHF